MKYNFNQFIDDLAKASGQYALCEAIKQGYKVCCEADYRPHHTARPSVPRKPSPSEEDDVEEVEYIPTLDDDIHETTDEELGFTQARGHSPYVKPTRPHMTRVDPYTTTPIGEKAWHCKQRARINTEADIKNAEVSRKYDDMIELRGNAYETAVLTCHRDALEVWEILANIAKKYIDSGKDFPVDINDILTRAATNKFGESVRDDVRPLLNALKSRHMKSLQRNDTVKKFLASYQNVQKLKKPYYKIDDAKSDERRKIKADRNNKRDDIGYQLDTDDTDD